MTNYNLGKLDILVIEQNPLTLEAIQMLLTNLGLKSVTCAPDVDQGFELFKKEPVDLVLCDWSPGVDGTDFLNRVRKDKAKTNPYIPVMILSAYSDEAFIQKAVNAGTNDFIAKPFTPRRIYQRLKKAIELPHLFIRSGSYFGPCRRNLSAAKLSNQFKRQTSYEGLERRIRDIDLEHEQFGYSLSLA